MNHYMLAQKGEILGPYSKEELLAMWKRRRMSRKSMVCQDGTEDWMAGRLFIRGILTERRHGSHSASAMPAPSAAPAMEDGQKGSAAGVCFAAVLLLGAVMHFAVPGGKMGLLITLLLGALIGLLGLVLLAQAAFLRGLATIAFVLFSAWGVVSRVRAERSAKGAEDAHTTMDRMLKGY
jgi:hypothetical protein